MTEKPRLSIYNLDQKALEEFLVSWGEPAYRAAQIWQGLYKNFFCQSDSFTNLPKPLQERLEGQFSFSSITPHQQLNSTDGETQKTLFRLSDSFYIETILMRYQSRNTLCISTQAGCALNCVFCATGQMGFQRDLSAGEIVEQVIFHARSLANNKERLTNVVLMGMGEPFLNYEAVMKAIDRLNDPHGFQMSERRMTISTAGIVPAIRRFTAEDRQVNLAVSLHAANGNLRSSLMPINRKYPLSDLIEACHEYLAHTHRRITFEWALLDGLNDSPENARELIQLVQGMLCHVNLIPLNPTTRFEAKGSTADQTRRFKSIVEAAGIPCTIRLRRGIDIQAGCGQLAGKQA